MKRYIKSNNYKLGRSLPTDDEVFDAVSIAIAYFSEDPKWNPRSVWAGQVYVFNDYFDEDSDLFIYHVSISTSAHLGNYSAYVYNSDIIDEPEIRRKYPDLPKRGSWYISGTGTKIRSLSEQYPNNVF